MSSGMTVMRIALIHSDPNGFIHLAKASASSGLATFNPVPRISPNIKLASIAVDSDGNFIL